MIKVGVSGCDTLRAHELVRVLVNHPDVELRWVSDHGHAGTRLDQVVPGLVGESDLTVVASGSPDEVDLVFLCGNPTQVASCLAAGEIPEGLHVIDLNGSHNLNHGEELPWKYGLGEMQRRNLVHDTRLITLPGSAAVATLLALMPLARNQKINSPLTVQVELGQSALASDGRTIDGMTLDEWAVEQRQEVEFALKLCQPDFNQPVELAIVPHSQRRMLAVTARLECEMDAGVLRELYDQYFDDHNFVFVVNRPATPADVENTSKCLITLDKDESTSVLTVKALMDVLLKGTAGNAVHAMNLMFGLHERAGLALKGTGC
jgi:N-acetyl-gamma-glutamyl-phosphate reductase